jgi:DNA-binding SARP family transcriptional activator
MAALSIRVLGDVEILVDGEHLAVDTRKAAALLAYLAVTRTSAARDQLAALLWTDSDPERARGALRRTLSVLRKALGGRWLTAEADRVRLEGEVWLDLDEAEARAAAGRPEAALELFRGDFLAGFSLRDSPDFDAWQTRTASEIRHRHSTILKEAAEAAVARGDLRGAVAHARRRVDLDPLDEDAHRQLMTALVWSGDRAGALRQYRECVRILDEELGVPPLPETSRLEERILFDDIPERPPAPTASGPEEAPHPTSAPDGGGMVGRRRELDRLRRLLGPDGGGVAAVTGAPGVGKSRLVDEAVSALAERGRPVARARAYEGEEDLGLVVVGEALRAALAHRPTAADIDPRAAAEAARLLPDLDLEPAPLNPADPGSRSRFFDGVCTTLSALLDDRGILVVDDLQWADPASLEVLGYLLRRPERFPVAVVLVWRTPTTGNPNPLQAVVLEQVERGRGLQLELSPLLPGEVEELAHRLHPGIQDETSRRVAEESGGNPLVALNYLRLMDPTTGSIPDGPALAHGLTEARLRGVSELGRQVLAAASIIGRAFDQGDLRGASGRTDEETAAALDELVRLAVLVDTGEGQFDFAHDQVREHVRETMGAVRRRLLHGRLADHLAGRHREAPGPTAGRLAHHLTEAGRLEEAAHYRAEAGDHARSVFAHTEARRHYEAALALGHPDATRIQVALGDLHTLAGDYASALDSYRTAAARAAGEALARVEHRLGEVNGRLGRWDLAVHHFGAAVAGLSDPDERISAYVDWARLYQAKGDLDSASTALARATSVAAESGSGLPPIVAIMEGLLEDDPDAAETRVEQGMAVARSGPDPATEAAGLTSLALIARRRGDVPTAVERVLEALEIVRRIGDRHRQATLHDLAADLFHEAGDEQRAREELTRAVALFAEVGTGGFEPAVWKTSPW